MSSKSESSNNENICEPCASLSQSSLLSKKEIEERLLSVPLWTTRPNNDSNLQQQPPPPPPPQPPKQQQDSDVTPKETSLNNLCLSRKFIARNFQSAQKAFLAFGEIAERENHHFDFHLTNYRQVELVLSTHKVGGLTVNDFVLANMLDKEVTVDYSPKWLKAHPEASK